MDSITFAETLIRLVQRIPFVEPIFSLQLVLQVLCGHPSRSSSYGADYILWPFGINEYRVYSTFKRSAREREQRYNWARTCENVYYAICEQQRCRSACASAQSDQHLCFRCLDSIMPLVSISEFSRL